jgi:hypothetical protein
MRGGIKGGVLILKINTSPYPLLISAQGGQVRRGVVVDKQPKNM